MGWGMGAFLVKSAKTFSIKWIFLLDIPLLCGALYGMLFKREKDTCLFREDSE